MNSRCFITLICKQQCEGNEDHDERREDEQRNQARRHVSERGAMDHREIQVLEHDEVQRGSGMNSSRGTSSKEWSVKLSVVVVQFPRRVYCIVEEETQDVNRNGEETRVERSRGAIVTNE